MAGGVFDELTDQEKEYLKRESDFLPHSEDETPGSVPDDGGEPDLSSSEPAEPPVPDEDSREDQASEDDDVEFERFKAKHGSKDPDKLLRMAWQQDKARREARYDAKRHADAVRNLQEGLQKKLADLRAKQQEEAKAFEERLQADPDAAVRETFRRQQQEEQEAAERETWKAYIDQQTAIARQIIPDFDTAAVEMARFGIEEIGYSPQEAFAVHDARDLKTLYMAATFNKLLKAGLVDMRGNLRVGATEPVPSDTPTGRLDVPSAPRSLGRIGQTGSGRVKTLQEQASQLLAMPDEDFAMVSEKELTALLRGLGGGQS